MVRKFWISCTNNDHTTSNYYSLHAAEPEWEAGRWQGLGMISLCLAEITRWLGPKNLPLSGECIEFECREVVTWLRP